MVELTDEMRQAVHDEDCFRLGHTMETRNAVMWNNSNFNDGQLYGPNGRIPHLNCSRCGRVWLVVGDEPGSDYEDALARFRNRVKPGREPVTPPR